MLVKDEYGDWESVLEDQLQSSVGLDCEVPIERFVLDNPRAERYVKFVVKTVVFLGGGLQYINFEYDLDAKRPSK